MSTYEEMFEKFTKVVETGNYPKFASVLIDPDQPSKYGTTLHEFLRKASDITTRYDPVPEGEKFYGLLDLSRTTYPRAND